MSGELNTKGEDEKLGMEKDCRISGSRIFEAAIYGDAQGWKGE